MLRLLVIASIVLVTACTSTLQSVGRQEQPPRGYRTISYALPETHVQIDIVGAEGQRRLANPMVLALQSERAFTLQYLAGSGSSDTIDIETQGGLLSSVEINREDQTADVIESLATALRSALSGLPSTAGESEENADGSGVTAPPFVAQMAFNPEAGLPDLSSYGLALSLAGHCSNIDETPRRRDAIYYARLTPRLLTVSRIGPDGARVPIQVIPYSTANCGLGAFEIGQFNWVESNVELTFAGGALTDVHIEKPSEAAALASVPIVVVDNVLGVARDLLTVRIERISSRSDILNAERDNYRAQIEAIEAYEDMIEALTRLRANAPAPAGAATNPPPPVSAFDNPGARN